MVLTKEAFLNHLYGGIDEPEMKIIDVFICKLRKKLAMAGADNLIGTVWGQGLHDAGPKQPRRPQRRRPPRPGKPGRRLITLSAGAPAGRGDIRAGGGLPADRLIRRPLASPRP